MSTKNMSQKMLSLAVVLAILAVAIALFTYLQTAFGVAGFNGPPAGTPPAGTGMLSVDATGSTLSVGGTLDVGGNSLTGLVIPTAGNEAASKDYVDQQLLAAGGGGGFYYRTCRWSLSETVGTGVAFGAAFSGVDGKSCTPPICNDNGLDPDDIDLGTESWTTAIDMELQEPFASNGLFVWRADGRTARVCQKVSS